MSKDNKTPPAPQRPDAPVNYTPPVKPENDTRTQVDPPTGRYPDNKNKH